MNKSIQLSPIAPLSEECINQIAAGEVIERPASVVKELLDNALDAGATQIDIWIEDGGRGLIRIADNGCGMDAQDLKLCTDRYTTSKLRNAQEIFSLDSRGFRGEALSSIASVSVLEILTLREGMDHALSTTIQHGIKGEIHPSVRTPGTTITVADLFANAPVRKKFLSSANTETQRVLEMCIRIALVHPQISFRLQSGTKTLLDLRSGSLQERIAEVLGNKIAKEMVAVSADEGPYEVYGFVGNPSIASLRRLKQYFYLENRPVENHQMMKSLERAWQAFFPGKHPPAVLIFKMPRADYDINAHPTKKEVRFARTDEAYAMTYRLMRRALDQVYRPQFVQNTEDADAYLLAPDFADEEILVQSEAPPQKASPQDLFAQAEKIVRFDTLAKPVQTQPFVSEPLESKSLSFGNPQQTKPQENRLSQDFPLESPSPYRPGNPTLEQHPEEPALRTFQWNQSFILAETASALLVIDQYRAHLRVLYDRAIKNLESAKCLPSQQLLFPKPIEFGPADAQLVTEHIDALFLLGFDLELFGKNAFRLRGIPSELGSERAPEALDSLLDSLRDGPKNQPHHKVALAFARSTAVHKGDVLSPKEMSELVHALLSSQNPYVCPQGKPLFHRLGLDEMERRFL
jgi:DNA mismatch repair protein MutL